MQTYLSDEQIIENSGSSLRALSVVGGSSYQAVPYLIEFDEKAGAIYIDFPGETKKTIKSDAMVLIDLNEVGISGIEILLDDKEVVKKLAKLFRPNSY
ncbi:hypothetical protein B6U96_12140 [Archaeoglobales archaeon ex4484_92]|nr:MAG: hypothetical protein B6U96_12140 [Archaeoglobales archaeon ex4484_92]